MSDSLTDALARLPHGPEFRFLDALEELEPGIRGRGLYKVRGDEPFLRGHFPGAPLFPGVLLVEAAAQLAGAVAQCDPQHAPIPGLKLAGIRAAKFKGSAHPGETIVFEARITARLGNAIQAEARACVNGSEILTTQVVLGGG